MTQLEQALTYLEQHEHDMLKLWETLVRMESPSADPAAVTRVGMYLSAYCDGFGMETDLCELEGAGTSFTARRRDCF